MKSNNPTIKQEAFCQAYIRLGDKSAAYREAYNCLRLKDKSVNELASKLSINIKVASRIKELQSKVAKIAEKKFEITSTEMLRHLNILRNSRIDEYVEYVEFDVPVTTTTGKGKNMVVSTTIERRTELRFKTFDKLTEDQLMCVESIKQNRYGEIELKLHGKEWTIEKINKHIGFYEKDNDQKNKVLLSSEDRDERIRKLEAKGIGK
jgi:phage terminase small subunit